MRPLLPLTCLCLAACFNSGNAEDQDSAATLRRFATGDFTAVALDGPDEVEVRTGGGFAVEAQGAPAVLDQLDVRRDGAMLKIARKPQRDWSWHTSGPVTVTVHMPEIHEAWVGGSGAMMLDRAADFTGHAAGAGDLTVGMLQGNHATLANLGSGTIAAAGAVEMLSATLRGSGSIEAPELRAEKAAVALHGSGTIAATVAGPATVKLHGSGTVDLGDMARCRVERHGSGALHCGS